MIAVVFGMVLPWLLIALGGLLAYQLLRQNGRILLRLDSIEQQLRERGGPPQRKEPAALRIGTMAPDFELPDLAGVRHKLSNFRGKDLLLIFFNPGCGFCTKMASDLAALPIEGGNGRAIPLVVTTGDVEANRKLVDQYGIRCTVLHQDAMNPEAFLRDVQRRLRLQESQQ